MEAGTLRDGAPEGEVASDAEGGLPLFHSPFAMYAIITFATAAIGTAKRAPGMPARSEPVATAITTPSGWTFTAVPMMSGWRMCPSTCCTRSTTPSMMSAITQPL